MHMSLGSFVSWWAQRTRWASGAKRPGSSARAMCFCGAIVAGCLLPIDAFGQQPLTARANRGRPAASVASPAPGLPSASVPAGRGVGQGAVGTVAPATATATSAADGRVSIEQLYQAAQQAKSVQQLEQTLGQIQQLQQNAQGSGHEQYLTQLQAWLLNRRGEAYALAAGRASEAGNEQDAVRWEEAAIGDFAASMQLDPQWRAYHNHGVSHAMLGNYDQALTSFEQAVTLNPQYPNTRFNRAELWLEMGKYAEAEQEYSAVIGLNPEDVDSRVGRGHARFYLGKFDESLEDFNEVIRRQPDNAVAYADRADLHAYLGHWEQAARDYRMAIKLDKMLGRAYQSAAWLMATCPEDRFRDPALALKAAQRALELDGQGDYRYLDTLAAAQANAQQYDQALQTMQQALKVAPADVQPELQGRVAQYQARQPFRDAVE